MTFEELKAEAKKQGYNLIKVKEYVPHVRCTCGKRPHIVYDDAFKVRCDICDKETGFYTNDDDAWREWMQIQKS